MLMDMLGILISSCRSCSGQGQGFRCCQLAWRRRSQRLYRDCEGVAPELAIVDGAPGLQRALAALWNNVPVQRCTVHKHR